MTLIDPTIIINVNPFMAATAIPTSTYTATPTPTSTPIPLGFPGNPITDNTQWTVVDQTFDGVQMVLVPVGCFDMGEYGEGGNLCFNEPFWIDRYEVTNEQFVRLGGASERLGASSGDKQPRDSITWIEAQDFCDQQREARLPTEAEWEYAARGPDGLVYPSGNDWETIKYNLVWLGNSNNMVAADVGSKSEGDSWVGAYDLAGNVWEWVNTIRDGFPYPYATDDGREGKSDSDTAPRVVRGGAWDSSLPVLLSATFRLWNNPYGYSFTLGFRCARDYDASDLNP